MPADDKSRKYNPLHKSSEVARLLIELEYLYVNWPEKDEGPKKDEAAHRALFLASLVFQRIAGWALLYRYSLAERDLRPTDTPGRPNPFTFEGVIVSGPLTPIQSRHFVRDLLMTISDQLHVQSDFVQALEALDYGQTLPPLEATTGARLGLPELHARLTALCYIEYLSGRGTKKSVTSVEVAQLFAANPESMKDWRADLTKRLGKTLVDTRLQQARVDGELFRKHSGPSEMDWTIRTVCEDAHGMEVLRRAAGSYRSRG